MLMASFFAAPKGGSIEYFKVEEIIIIPNKTKGEKTMITVLDKRKPKEYECQLHEVPDYSVFQLIKNTDKREFVKIGLASINLATQEIMIFSEAIQVIVGRTKANINITVFE